MSSPQIWLSYKLINESFFHQSPEKDEIIENLTPIYSEKVDISSMDFTKIILVCIGKLSKDNNPKTKYFLVYSDPQSFVQLKTDLEFYRADKISDFSSHIEYHWKIVKLQRAVEFSCSAQNGWSSAGGWKIGKASKRAILIRARNKNSLNGLR